MRNLFKAAKEEEEKKGPDSRLFVIIFDEFDAIGMQRGAGRGDTGVGVRLQCTIAVYDVVLLVRFDCNTACCDCANLNRIGW